MSVKNRIERAFETLVAVQGFHPRENQLQLALVLSDLIEGGSTGAVEAPTGLGKSLAALVPAIAQAIESGRRTVIATYTNVLAEQYWRKDLPIAMGLFDVEERPRAAYLIGRQRYACLEAMRESMPSEIDRFKTIAELGSETEFRSISRKPTLEISQLWRRIAAPPVCPGRLCPQFDACYFFSARRKAETAPIVITNHSVVIQDALNRRDSDSDSGMLGEYDFLIVDEAHDFLQAAQSGLEFDLSNQELAMLKGIVTRLERSLEPFAEAVGRARPWKEDCDGFRSEIDAVATSLSAYGGSQSGSGILAASPASLMEHPNLARNRSTNGLEPARAIALRLSASCAKFSAVATRTLDEWEDCRPDLVRSAREAVRSYLQYIQQVGGEAGSLFDPVGVMVSYSRTVGQDTELRSDTVGLAGPLEDLIWSKRPHALLSATLAVDGSFEFINRSLGCNPGFVEILDSPFDFSSQAALYLPREGAIPDPTLARAEGAEEAYYDAVAIELRRILIAMNGRTLALFHSRKEMEAVASRIELPPELSILVQYRTGAATAGDRFKADRRASLFALRSFWTGFDAPGETLSCVALVRVPFEVPIEPPALARMAYLESNGLNPFASWTLPMAKMMIRQGAGRLIRTTEDRGLIALLDPRLRTKRYGEEILDNLPAGLRRYDDIDDAVGWIGLNDGESG